MNLQNPFRAEIAGLPGGGWINDAIDLVTARINAVWLVEHKGDGTHASVTADGDVTAGGDVTAAGEGPHTFGGDVIARNRTGTEVALGALTTVDGTTLLAGVPVRYGVLIGGVANGFFLTHQPKDGLFTGSGDELAIWHLAHSTSDPIIQIALDGSTPTFADGGSGSTALAIGNGNRPIGSVTASTYYKTNYSAGQGEWTAVAYSAGNFTASAGSWTVDSGDQTAYRYTVIGKTMFLQFDIRSTDVSSAGASLRIAIPGGFTAGATTQQALIRVSDAGAASAIGLAVVSSGASYVELNSTLAGAGFALTAADNTSVFGQLFFEVA